MRIQRSESCTSAGDALRDSDEKGLIQSDPFVLVSGDVVSSMNLSKVCVRDYIYIYIYVCVCVCVCVCESVETSVLYLSVIALPIISHALTLTPLSSHLFSMLIITTTILEIN